LGFATAGKPGRFCDTLAGRAQRDDPRMDADVRLSALILAVRPTQLDALALAFPAIDLIVVSYVQRNAQ
jgi:hypothetical protein